VKGYGDRVLIDGLSFQLPPGGIVGIIGPNGAGKTTLFRLIAELEPPDSGTIRTGETVTMSYVDQSRDALRGEKNVWEEISNGEDEIELAPIVDAAGFVAMQQAVEDLLIRDLAPPGAVLSHMRVDARFLYVTDAGFGVIVVIDRATGRGHRVLEGAPCSRADRTITPMIHGKALVHPDGRVPVINLSHLELSPDGAWMYFTPLFGPTLWRVPTTSLHDPRLRTADVAAQVESVVRIPPVTGITADAAGNLYLSALTEDGVLRLGADRRLQTLIRDDRISGPNEGSIGPDGFYYFPNSQAPRVNRPYEVFKIALPGS